MEKVSVVVPVYNVKNYLERAVKSILVQTFPNIEVILVDDGSTDGSGLLCDEIVSKYSNTYNIKSIHKENGGLSSARNAGMEVATGKYVLFIDSDDYISNDMVEQLYLLTKKTNSDLSICSYIKVDEKGKELSKLCLEDQIINISNENDKYNFLLHRFLEYNVTWEAWNKLYDLSLIRKNNLKFELNSKVFSEDMCFNSQYILCCNVVAVSSRHCYFYVQRNGSIMSDNREEPKIKQHIEMAKVVNTFAESKGYVYIVKNFYLVFYMLMNTEYYKMRNFDEAMIKSAFAEVDKDEFLIENTKAVIKNWKFLLDEYEIAGALQRTKFATTILKALGEKTNVKNVSIFFYQKWLVTKALFRLFVDNLDKLFGKKIYLIGTEDFGNLGDHMIAEAEVAYLADKYIQYKLIEITASNFESEWVRLKKRIKKNDIIFLTGGGNMGNEYELAEQIRRNVISYCKGQEIIIFPQTIYYTNDECGKRELEITKKIYNQHKKLKIIAREKYSYKFAKENFTGEIDLKPDVVLDYKGNIIQNDVQREGALLCLRSDKEKGMASDMYEYLETKIHNSGELIYKSETQKDYCISKEKRKKALKDYFILLQSSNLVVTDRLHGMIFSAITDTPCIVFPNYNHKIEGCYEWLRNKKNIWYVKTKEEFDKAYKEYQEM